MNHKMKKTPKFFLDRLHYCKKKNDFGEGANGMRFERNDWQLAKFSAE